MSTNLIKSEFGDTTAMTITVASLASSTSGVGRQSTMVDNSATGWELVHLFVKLTSGVSTGGTFAAGFAYVYLIKSDGTIRSDGAGASDAALTVVNARLLGAIKLAASGTAYYGDFEIEKPGKSWGIAIIHNTVAQLDGTAGNHSVTYYGENPDIQAAA